MLFYITLLKVMQVVFCINLSQKVWSTIMILPIMVFSWIRNLDNLAPLALVANIGIFFGLFVIIGDEIYKLSGASSDGAAVLDTSSDHPIQPYGGFIATCVFLGNAIYSFEGIGVVSCVVVVTMYRYRGNHLGTSPREQDEEARECQESGVWWDDFHSEPVCILQSLGVLGVWTQGTVLHPSQPLRH